MPNHLHPPKHAAIICTDSFNPDTPQHQTSFRRISSTAGHVFGNSFWHYCHIFSFSSDRLTALAHPFQKLNGFCRSFTTRVRTNKTYVVAIHPPSHLTIAVVVITLRSDPRTQLGLELILATRVGSVGFFDSTDFRSPRTRDRLRFERLETLFRKTLPTSTEHTMDLAHTRGFLGLPTMEPLYCASKAGSLSFRAITAPPTST